MRAGRRGWAGTRRAGVGISAATYVLALGAALLAGWSLGAAHPLLVIAVAEAAATALVFAASVVCDNSSLYDPYWSLQPAAIAGYYLVLADGRPDGRALLVAGLVLLYAVRLTSNFYRDWPGLSKEDFRYVGFRRRFGRLYWPVSFFGIHLFPTVMVYLGCLPLYGAMRGVGGPLGWLDGVAAVVTLGSVTLALVADEQLRRFRRDPRNAGENIVEGLWGWSRHPNYLGEITTWWGLLLFALAAGPRWWWTGIGAAAITLLFVFVSVPMMERRTLATRPAYAAYRGAVPMLLPLGRRRTGR